MGFYTAYLLADVLFQVIESVEMPWRAVGRAHFVREPLFQFVFANFQQAAIRVVDDDELLGVQEMMRNDQGAKRIFGGDAAGIADHVCVAGV